MINNENSLVYYDDVEWHGNGINVKQNKSKVCYIFFFFSFSSM